MSSFIATIVLFGALFAVSYMTKRRFGVLGLALSAGALLSLHWASTVTPFLEARGITTAVPPLSSLVQIALIVAPPFILLFSGPKYTKKLPQLLGALAFAGLALVFISDILASILVLEQASAALYQFLHDNKSILIVVGIIAAITDVLFTRKQKAHKDSKKSGHH